MLNVLGGLTKPLVKTAATPPFLVPPLANLLVQIMWFTWYDAISVILYQRFRWISSAWLMIPGTELEISSLREVLNCHGGDEKWLMVWWCSSSSGKRVKISLALRQKLQQFWKRWAVSVAKAILFGWLSVLQNSFSPAFRIKRLLHVWLLWTSSSKRKAFNCVDTSCPVMSRRG